MLSIFLLVNKLRYLYDLCFFRARLFEIFIVNYYISVVYIIARTMLSQGTSFPVFH